MPVMPDQNQWMKMLQAQQDEQPPVEQPEYPAVQYPEPQGQFAPQQIAFMNQILQKGVEGIDAQKAGAKKIDDYRDREANRPLDPDYTALMMASDAWNNTKFLPSYKTPQSDQDRSKTVLEADLLKQKALGGITDDELNLLKTQFYGAQVAKQGQPKEKVIKPTQYQAATYAKRIEQAEQNLNSLMDNPKTSAELTSMWSRGTEAIAPQALKSENFKLFQQARDNFINSVLRRESGAAISAGEYETADRQYFPTAGDSAEVLSQKKANRDIVLQGIRSEAGDAFNKIHTEAPSHQKKSSDSSFPNDWSPEKIQKYKKAKGIE